MYKAINNIRDQKGFTLIELLIVVAIIGILAAIAIPGYIGMQERGRRGGMIRGAESAAYELQGWMNAAKKAGTAQGGLIEVDTNGDGIVAAPDVTNTVLGGGNVLGTFVTATQNMNQVSPWNSANDLWVDGGGPTTQAACSTAATAGQIRICYAGTNAGSGLQTIFIAAADNTPTVFYSKAISAD